MPGRSSTTGIARPTRKRYSTRSPPASILRRYRASPISGRGGKASLAMARRGWDVTAVEPGEGMLEVLRARAAAEGLSVDTRPAAAEDTGLPDASVDLVTAAQAY